MTTLIANKDVRTIAAGILVSRPSTNTGNTPLGSVNLFTVSGGRILLRAFVGTVKTIIQAQATTVKFTSTPTTGSAIDLNVATASDLTGREVGGMVTLPNPPAAATVAVITNAGYTNLEPLSVVIPAGVISVTYGAASTGAIQYDLIYVPLDNGAQVVAVA
jgi:hypothetical protein